MSADLITQSLIVRRGGNLNELGEVRHVNNQIASSKYFDNNRHETSIARAGLSQSHEASTTTEIAVNT